MTDKKRLHRVWNETKRKANTKLLKEKKPGLLKRIGRKFKREPKIPDGAVMTPPEWWRDFKIGSTLFHAGHKCMVVDRYSDCVVIKVGEISNAEKKRRKAGKKRKSVVKLDRG